jgi:predicted esterase
MRPVCANRLFHPKCTGASTCGGRSARGRQNSLRLAIGLFAFVLAAWHATANADGREKVMLAESPSVIEPAVTYLSHAPEIDGLLDDDLGRLPVRHFTTISKSSSENPDVPLHYRLAYGIDFFYVYIEAESEGFVYRDRAYQNGDGFTVVLAVPRPENAPSEEFYVLACSAVDREPMEWTRTIFWYYNVDNIFLRTSDDTKMEFRDGDGTIHFELLLPWKDVHPYHPWLSDGIGFNLGMVKAIGETDRNFYKVVDATIGSENSPREYALLRFEEPRHDGEPRTFVRLARNNVSEGDTLVARAVTVASEASTESLRALVKSGEMTTVDFERVDYECGGGLTYDDFIVEVHNLPSGGYVVEWYSKVSDSRGETGLTILPSFDDRDLNRRLEDVQGSLSPVSYTTLQFTIEEIGKELEEVYPYETAAPPRIRLSRLIDYIERAKRGEDAFAKRRGFVRLAYRSQLDDTLQPYVVWIPEDFDPAKRYPLLVFLHGSASTEYNIVGMREIIPEGFIALGPKGRGPSNWYSWDHAQTDVAEAVRSVQSSFPIDDRNIFLSGFSMGGYGVYRTFYETPETYRAIAVFSGIPGVEFGAPDGESLIDFNEEKYVDRFDGVPVFIFHGKRDRNAPFEETERFIGKLEAAGARVEFHTEEDKGHEPPSEKTIEAFHRWVEKTLAR